MNYYIYIYIYSIDNRFDSESRIKNNGTREIEKGSEYLFSLKPLISSLSPSTTIEITFRDNYLRPHSTSCTSNIGTCAVLENGIRLNTPYPSGYTCCFYTQFVVDGIWNPNSSIPYSLVAFDILAIDGGTGTVVYGNNMPLYTGGTYAQYTPHQFGGISGLFGYYSSTITIANYTFILENTYFAIPRECLYMDITLPPGMQFISPVITVIQGLSPMTISYSNSTYMKIANAFSEGIPFYTTMRFQINNIQNPYATATDLIFGIRLYWDSDSDTSFAQSQTEFSANIDRISDFSLFKVSSSSMMVSQLSNYTIEYQLREGNLVQNDFVKLTVPNSIKYCDESSIYPTLSCNNNILSANKYKYTEYEFGFKLHLCTNYNGTTVKFNITCRNPETRKPTGDFTLQAQSDEDSTASIYYRSIGDPITMTTLNTFSPTVTPLHQWCDYSNKFLFSIEKTSPNISSDIDELRIELHGNYGLICPNIGDINGITADEGGLSLTCTTNSVIINNISALSKIFGFSLDKIRYPGFIDQYIRFVIYTRNSGGYDGEYGASTCMYPLCAYPCKTCTPGLITNCTSCYSEDNEVFEGGTSMHEHISGESATCRRCPTHTYFDSSSCTNCDPNCKECQDTSTTCTECYDNTFLLNAVCESPTCPNGYSDNVDDWSCVLIRGYESGTQITVLDSTEVEKISRYRFVLKPEVELRWRDSKVEITSPPSIGSNVSCYSSYDGVPVGCSISGSVITIPNLLYADYTAGVTAPIQIDIYDTYTNPPLTYLYTQIKFIVKAMINNTLYHSAQIPLSGSASTDTRYIPHILASSPILYTNSCTVSFNTLTFNLTNIDYLIPIGYKIILTFPPDLILSSTDEPIYTPLENLDGITSLAVFTYPSIMQITGVFTGASLLPNENIGFSVSNILNPYKLGLTATIQVDIAAGNGTELEKQFTLNTGLTMNIINIAEFSTFSINTNSDMTSMTTDYYFRLTLGDGRLTTAHKIGFQVPDTVKNCEANSLEGIEGISSVLINKNYDSCDNKYYFDLPCSIDRGTYIQFKMICQNPETTMPTGDFMILATIISSPTDIFYSSTGSSLRMNTLNTFEEIELSMTDNRPLVNNNLTLTVTRTASYPSTHIDTLEIVFPSHMNISSASHNLISGITGGTFTYIIAGQTILIVEGITQLLQVFSLVFLDIQNPPLSTDDIILNVLTLRSDGLGEQANSNILHTACDFPCETCEVSIPTNCLSCFPANDPVHPIGTPEASILEPNRKQCLDDCPFPHIQNGIDWLCERTIYIYIYIYRM